MQWLNKIVDELEQQHPDGEIVVSSGVSPSGIYHVGHLREVLTADAVYIELKRRGRQAKHLHVVDDLDVLRKIPPNIPESFEEHLGKSLCDIPAPDGSDMSYADYFFKPFLDSMNSLGVEMEIIRAHKKYRSGFFALAIEQALDKIPQAKAILEEISHRKLDPNWSPIQVNEGGYLKNRKFLKIDKDQKLVYFEGKDGKQQSVNYEKGEVKLDWRLDWPARWALLGVNAEPFGRDHATKGGSYDTGVGLVRDVFDAEPPLPVPYDFINRAGDTKKMSASKGTGIEISEFIKVLPPEVARFFVLRYAPSKLLFFDSGVGTVQLIDDYAAVLAASESADNEQLLAICNHDPSTNSISRVPFSHLVASYQSALKDAEKTMQIIARTEHADVVEEDKDIIAKELKYIDEWLNRWAPEDVKFELTKTVDASQFSDAQTGFLTELGGKVEQAPEDADGEWFHAAIYELKETSGLQPKELFQTIYQATIGKDSGPRAGWFLSILPRDWLVKRLKLEE